MDSVASRLVAVGNNAFQQEETKVLLIDFTCFFIVETLKLLRAHCVFKFVSWWLSSPESRELYDPTEATPPLKYSSLQNRERDWAELIFTKTSGTVTKDRDKIGQ